MKDYRFTLTIPVIFHDLDAMGHVNNVVYLTYFETARIAYYMHLTGQKDLSHVDIILAEITCTYKSPATYGETLILGVRVEELRSRSFTIRYRLEDQADGRLIAAGHSVQVTYDYATRQTKPLPPAFIQAAEEYEGRTLKTQRNA